MKNYINYLVLTALFGLFLCSCENDAIGNSTPPHMGMQLIKFTDDQYSEYILAWSNNGVMKMRVGRAPVVEELVIGKNPYSVKLPNGYWVIDWKWGNNLVWPESALLPYKWETLTHWGQTWDVSDNILSPNVYRIDYAQVYRRTIDNQLSINQDIDRTTFEGAMLYDLPASWGQKYKREADIPDGAKEWYFEDIRRQDSLHAIYVQRLIRIVENGDFDKVYNVYPQK